MTKKEKVAGKITANVNFILPAPPTYNEGILVVKSQLNN